MEVTLSAVESSQPFPACTKVLANDGIRFRVLSHSFPMMPVHTQQESGTKRGILSARPGILTDVQIRKAKAADGRWAADGPYKLSDGGGFTSA
jgi:hypothetical protein